MVAVLSKAERLSLRGVPLLTGLSDQCFEALSGSTSGRRLGRGETLFAAGEPAEHLFIVLDGWIKLYRTIASGSEVVFDVCGRGTALAEVAVLAGAPFPVSATAVSRAVVAAIPRAGLVARISLDPGLATAMIGCVFGRLQDLLRQMEGLKTRTSKQRVVEFLLSLAQDADGVFDADLPYEKQLIAAHLGLKPETLSRALANLRCQGVKVTGHHVELNDVGRLRRLLDGPVD